MSIARQYVRAVAAVAALACLAWPSSAEEPAIEFLHAAQDQGYGEVAIDYLEQLRAAGRLPHALTETLDLELSRSYRIAAGEAFNAPEADARMAKAQAHLDTFLKEQANHPEVARAIESWGDLVLDRGLEHLGLALNTKAPAEKEKLLAAARVDLEEARPRFADATARYSQRFTKLKAAVTAEGARRPKSATPSSRKQRQAEQAVRDAEIAWLECRSKCAKIEFFTALTYADKGAPQRKSALLAAETAFDDVFQSYRESLVGLHAHLWHGRTVDEQGNDPLALDIYDEVLAVAPDGRERDSGLEPLFAQAQYYRLLVLQRKEGPQTFLAEAAEWLKQHRTWQKYEGYQGTALEVAKANLKQAEALSGARKSSQVRAALDMLADVAKVRGEHQQEAILLRREHTKLDSADPATVKTFDEGVALGEAAIENLDWAGASALLARALQLNNSATDTQRLDQARTRLDQARYQVAAAQFGESKFEACLATADEIARDRPDGPLAPAAMSLAASAALSLYARADDKQAAFARLDAIAQEMLRRWPDKAEADDARIALGQASLVRGELTAAAAAFEDVNPRSLRYPFAMLLAGQTNWRLYLGTKADAGADQVALDARRAKAERQLETSLEALRKASPPSSSPGGQLLDAQLMLAEVKLAGQRAQEAAALVEPLMDAVARDKPKPLDNIHLRVFLTYARAEAPLGKWSQVAEAARLLAESGDDTAAVNGVLSSMLQLLIDGWKQATAESIEARTAGDQPRRAAADAAIVERQKLVALLVPQLAKRKANPLATLISIADTAAQLGQNDSARELYQSVLSHAEADAAFQQANAQALTRVQAQLVGLLRQQGRFDEGLKEIDKLIEKFPNALEPKMEKGRLLQSWADTDASRFAEAVAHWTELRTRMARMARKPPEYYEVVYNAAECLFEEGRKTTDRAVAAKKALQAEQLLQATLVLSPKLSGPELVARYKELLQKSRQLQGRPASGSPG